MGQGAGHLMAADVITLPVKPLTCLDCENCALVPSGVYCLMFGQQILDEQAEDCDGYMPFDEL